MGRYLVETHRLSRSHASALLRHRTLVRMSKFDINIKRLLLSTAQAEKQTLLSGRDSIKSQLEELDPSKAEIVSDLEAIEKTFKRVQRTYAGAIDVGNAYTSARNNRKEAREKQVALYIKSNRVKDDHIKILGDRLTSIRNQKSGATNRAETLKLASSPFVTISNGLRALPNIVGMAVGGYDLGAMTQAISDGFNIVSKVFEIKTLILDYKEEETVQEVATKLKVAELKQQQATFDLQLKEQDIRIESAQSEVDRAMAFLDASRQQLALCQDDEAAFRWSLDQLSRLHASVFQSTMNLCLLAEASLQIELASPGKQFIPRDAWNDRHRGWFAGEALHNALLAMDAARFSPSARPFRITRRISLQAHGKRPIQEQFVNGSMSFDLTSRTFDEDFPGHYFRRIRFVKVSILQKEMANTMSPSDTSQAPSSASTTGTTGVATTIDTNDATNAISAILTQVSNNILIKEDNDAVAWLYNPTAIKPDAVCDRVRLGQQIAISRLTTDPDTTPRETFAIQEDMEGKYDYFEYTGAISSWTLQFPCAEKRWKPWLDRIDDIVLEITYESFAGSADFRAKVLTHLTNETVSTPTLPTTPAQPPRVTLILPVSNEPATTDPRYPYAMGVLQSAMDAWATLYETHGGSAEAATPDVKAKLSPYYATFSEAAVVRRMNRLFRPRPELTSINVTLGDVAQGDFTFRVKGSALFPDGRSRPIDDRAVVRVTDGKAAIVLHAHWIEQTTSTSITPPVRPVTLPASVSPAANDAAYAGIKDVLEKSYEAWVKLYELLAGDRGAAMDSVERQSTLTKYYSSFRTESVDHRVSQLFRPAPIVETVDVWKPKAGSDSYTLRIRGYTIVNGARSFFDDKALVNPGSNSVLGEGNTAKITAHLAWHLITPSLDDAVRITIPVPTESSDAVMHQHCEEIRQYLEKILGVGASLYDKWKRDLAGSEGKFTEAFSAHLTVTDAGDRAGYARLLVKNKPKITACNVELKESNRLIFMMDGTELLASSTKRKSFTLHISVDFSGNELGIRSVRTGTPPQGTGDRPKLTTTSPPIAIPAPSNIDESADATIVWARHYLEEVYGAGAGIVAKHPERMEEAITEASAFFGKHAAYPSYSSSEYRRDLERILKSEPTFSSTEVTKDNKGFITFRLHGTALSADGYTRESFDEFVVVECTEIRTVIARIGVSLPDGKTVTIPTPTTQADAIEKPECEPARLYLERLYAMGAVMHKKYGGNFENAKREILYRLGLEMPGEKDNSNAMLSAMILLFRSTPSFTACEVSLNESKDLVFKLRGTTSDALTGTTIFDDQAVIRSIPRYTYLKSLKMNPPSGIASLRVAPPPGLKRISIGSVTASEATRDPRWEWVKQFVEIALGLGVRIFSESKGDFQAAKPLFVKYLGEYCSLSYDDIQNELKHLFLKQPVITSCEAILEDPKDKQSNFQVKLKGSDPSKTKPFAITVRVWANSSHTLLHNTWNT